MSQPLPLSPPLPSFDGRPPVARDRPATEVGGWGLHLVQTLSNRWGVHEGSTHVWFEIDR